MLDAPENRALTLLVRCLVWRALGRSPEARRFVCTARDREVHMNRRWFIKGSVWGALSFILNGCATAMLYAPSEYTEKFDAVLLSADGKYLAVMTEKYHYIFNDIEILSYMLKSDMHQHIRANIRSVHVYSDSKVKSAITLCLTDYPLQLARERTGLRWDEHGLLSVPLYGKRYESGNFQKDTLKHNLYEEHIIRVTEEISSAQKITRSPLTPITVASDGVMTIGTIPLIVVGVVAWNTLDMLKNEIGINKN